MSAVPVVCWLTREAAAALAAYARKQGEPVERIAGFLVESELKRRKVITPPLPDMSQPSKVEHSQALREAHAESMEAFGRPSQWRSVRGSRS
jgi:hypothetical protein